MEDCPCQSSAYDIIKYAYIHISMCICVYNYGGGYTWQH